MNVKQVIVVRKDLNMRKGKIAAQASHASMGAILMLRDKTKQDFVLELSEPVKYWLDNSFTKICVYVNSEEELVALSIKATQLGILNCLITDSGKTEFNGVPTTTCLAIGPDLVENVNLITDKLSLF